MSTLRSAVVAVACLSTSVAFAGGGAKLHALKGHPNLIKAEKDLHAAYASITKSQEANECAFGVEGGHGHKAKEAIEVAAKEVWEAAEWVNTHGKECSEHAKTAKAAEVKAAGAVAMKAHPELKGHPNMVRAEKELIDAYAAIVKSQEANECSFGVEGGHGQKAKAAIEAAFKEVTDAAEWVNGHEADCKGKK